MDPKIILRHPKTETWNSKIICFPIPNWIRVDPKMLHTRTRIYNNNSCSFRKKSRRVVRYLGDNASSALLLRGDWIDVSKVRAPPGLKTLSVRLGSPGQSITSRNKKTFAPLWLRGERKVFWGFISTGANGLTPEPHHPMEMFVQVDRWLYTYRGWKIAEKSSSRLAHGAQYNVRVVLTSLTWRGVVGFRVPFIILKRQTVVGPENIKNRY